MIKRVIRDQFITLGFCSLWGPIAAASCLKDQEPPLPKRRQEEQRFGGGSKAREEMSPRT